MIFVILTMIFKAPVVPYFLTLKNLGFYNNPIVLVIPHIFSAYNMAIMRTSFKAFPSEIEEAAVMDGCGTAQVLFRIVFPSSKAMLTTMALFYGVTAWNQFQHPLMFINDVDWYPLQMKIRQMINGGTEVMLTVLKVKKRSYDDFCCFACYCRVSMAAEILCKRGYAWFCKGLRCALSGRTETVS